MIIQIRMRIKPGSYDVRAKIVWMTSYKTDVDIAAFKAPLYINILLSLKERGKSTYTEKLPASIPAIRRSAVLGVWYDVFGYTNMYTERCDIQDDLRVKYIKKKLFFYHKKEGKKEVVLRETIILQYLNRFSDTRISFIFSILKLIFYNHFALGVYVAHILDIMGWFEFTNGIIF